MDEDLCKQFQPLFDTLAEHGVNSHVRKNLRSLFKLICKQPCIACPILEGYIAKNPSVKGFKLIYDTFCGEREV